MSKRTLTHRSVVSAGKRTLTLLLLASFQHLTYASSQTQLAPAIARLAASQFAVIRANNGPFEAEGLCRTQPVSSIRMAASRKSSGANSK